MNEHIKKIKSAPKIIVCLVVASICFLCNAEPGKCSVCGNSKGYFEIKVGKSTEYLCSKHICNKHNCKKDRKSICTKCESETNEKKNLIAKTKIKEDADKFNKHINKFKDSESGMCWFFINARDGVTVKYTAGLYKYTISDNIALHGNKSKQIKGILLCDIYENKIPVICEFKSKTNKNIAKIGFVKIDSENLKGIGMQAFDVHNDIYECSSYYAPILINEDDVLDLTSSKLTNDIINNIWNIDSEVLFNNMADFKSRKLPGFYKTIVTAKLDDYYNYCYADCENTHISARLYEESEGSLSGYANRKSTIGKKLYSLLQDGKEHKIEVYVCHPTSMVMDLSNWDSGIVDIVAFKEIEKPKD